MRTFDLCDGTRARSRYANKAGLGTLLLISTISNSIRRLPGALASYLRALIHV